MSWGKPLFWSLLLLGGAGYGLWWLDTCPVTYVDDRGFSVDFPRGWDTKKEGEEIISSGLLSSGGGGSGNATFHPHTGSVDWPTAGLSCLGGIVKWHELNLIDERPGLLALFERDGQKCIGAVVDRGDGLIAWSVSCDPRYFDQNRGYFERCGGGIRCNAKE